MTRRASSGAVVKRRWSLSWLRRGGLFLVTALVVEYFVVPQLAGARAAMDQLSQVTPGFLAVGLALELGSLSSYSALTHCVLPPLDRPDYWSILRIDVSALGLSHLVPGGGATASALRYRLFTVAGVPPADELGATAIEGTGVAGTLVLVFIAGLALAFPSAHDNAYFLVAGGIAAVLLAAAAGAGVLVTRRETQAVSWARRLTRVLPKTDPGDAQRLVESLAGRLRSLASDRRLMTRSIAWASANWIFDAAALWVFLRAFGATEGLQGLLLGYGLAGILAVIPLTPGGLGIVEATLISVLVGFGTPHPQAVLGVITWRLAEFWMPIPLAALAYLSLRTGALRPQNLPARPLIPRAEPHPRSGRPSSGTHPDGVPSSSG